MKINYEKEKYDVKDKKIINQRKKDHIKEKKQKIMEREKAENEVQEKRWKYEISEQKGIIWSKREKA